MTFEKSIERKFTFLRRQMLALLIVLLLLLVMMIAIIGNQFALIKTVSDAMDQLNYIRQEVEATEPEPGPEPTDPTALSIYQLTPDEFALICRVVMSESGGENLQAQMAVAQTIYDRMNDFGETLQEAIRAYSQHDNGDPTDSVRLAVANVFENGMRVYEGGTYQFHDSSVDPCWTTGKIDRGSIGNLRFYGGWEQ